jgi:3-hydroxyisobutyryl-CoA hydrolase
LATHYVSSSIPDLLEEVVNAPNTSLESLASLLSSKHTAAPQDTAPSSKSSPEGPTPITGTIRDLLESTFSLKSVPEIHEALGQAASDESLSEEAREWAKVQAGLMDERSPTGMAVALEGYRRVKKAKRLDVALVNGMFASGLY